MNPTNGLKALAVILAASAVAFGSADARGSRSHHHHRFDDRGDRYRHHHDDRDKHHRHDERHSDRHSGKESFARFERWHPSHDAGRGRSRQGAGGSGGGDDSGWQDQDPDQQDGSRSGSYSRQWHAGDGDD